MYLLLISLGVANDDVTYGLEYNLNVKPETPMLDIPKVFLHSSSHIVNCFCLSALAMCLSPSCDSWLNEMTYHIVAYLL